MTDKELRQDVIDEFAFDPSFNGAHVGVAVEGNVVTLTGHVETYTQKLAAVTAARRVKGVCAIADEIEVRRPSQLRIEDDQIAKRAIDILKWNSTVSPYTIDVLVRAGWITLNGVVNWQFEKRVAEDCVRRLSGIVGVTNKIQLNGHVTANDVKAKIEAALKRQAALEANAIRVSVSGGDRVVLEGEVDSWNERRAAENAAWSAPGVTTVDDRITIR